MIGSLRARMTLGFSITLLFFALISCLAFHLWMRQAAHEDAEERTWAAAEHLVLEWKSDRSPAKAFEEVHEDARLDRVSMIIADKSGRTIGQDGHPTLPWPKPRAGWVVHSITLHRGTVAAGIHWIPIESELLKRTLSIGLFALLATLVAGSATWFIVGRTLQPIDQLAGGAEAASANPFLARLTAPSKDAEMVHLVATLNGMLDRLREDSKGREQFYAAAAHELRTPLTVLIAEIEVTLSRPRMSSEYIDALENLRTQTLRLAGLSESLLALNRLNVGSANEAPEPVDLADLVARSVSSLSTTILANQLFVECHYEEPGEELLAPPSHAMLIVHNLLENAVRYATPGGQVNVTVSDRLVIKNDFPNELPLDLERLFDPFVQGDASRSGKGNGLGLTLCRRIAVLNGWQLALRREDGFVVAEVVMHS